MASTIYNRDFMLIHGGGYGDGDGDIKLLNDLYLLDIKKLHWLKVENKGEQEEMMKMEAHKCC